MSSWFSSESFQSLKATATSLASNVQDGILKKMDSEMMQKLTLSTPELSAERARIDAEERRKEMVHDKLAGMLPWETRDSERDILVDECKEAILKLSADASTFTGPWKMPEKGVNLKNKKKKKSHDDSADGEEHGNAQDGGGGGEEEDEDKDDDEDDNEEARASTGPSQASIEKLEKLQPLPPLLQDFDLDSHVGLIQRLLQEDPELVKMQSTLSGGGAREKVFWHNYFFHCAYTRYEAGLSIDEIWSDQPPPTPSTAAAAGGGGVVASDGTGATTEDSAHDEEHTIVFHGTDESGTDSATASSSGGGGKAAVAATLEHAEPGMKNPTTPAADSAAAAAAAAAGKDSSENAGSKDCSDYEIVGGADGNYANMNNGVGDAEDEVDYELDELEEEIARELEG